MLNCKSRVIDWIKEESSSFDIYYTKPDAAVFGHVIKSSWEENDNLWKEKMLT